MATSKILSRVMLPTGHTLTHGAKIIPQIDQSKYGGGWLQPRPAEFGVQLDDQGKPVMIYMSQSARDYLKDYSCSFPSGVYEGKMWKAEVIKLDGTTEWVLRWYDADPKVATRCLIHECPIILFEVLNLIYTEEP